VTTGDRWIEFRPHWAQVIGTFGFAALKRPRRFDSASHIFAVASTPRRWWRSRELTFAIYREPDRERVWDFVNPGRHHEAELQDAIQAAGFTICRF
jgi:hypothetical protein